MTLHFFLFCFFVNIPDVRVRIFNLLGQEVEIKGGLLEVMQLVKERGFANEQVVMFEYNINRLFVDAFTSQPLNE